MRKSLAENLQNGNGKNCNAGLVHMLYLTYAETTPDLGYDSNGGQRLQKMVATGSGGLEEHMARFTLPRDLYHGKGALEALKDFEGKRAMICVGGGSMKRFGFLDRAKQYLEEAGMEVCLFEGIEPDPSVETVMKGAKAMEEFKPTGSWRWAAALRLMQQRQCGSSMNIRTLRLKICARYSEFRSSAKRHISARSLPHPERRRK